MRTFLVIPLFAFGYSSSGTIEIVEDYADYYGYQAFRPENLKQLKEMVGSENFCLSLKLVLMQIIRNEHLVWDEIYKLYKKSKTREYKLHKAAKNTWNKSLKQYIEEKCWVDDIPEGFLELGTQLYVTRDNEFLFRPLNKEEKKEGKIEAATTEMYTVPEFQIGTVAFALVLLDDNDDYLGHIYGWPDHYKSKQLSIIGIRTSIRNFFCKEHKEIALSLLEGIALFAKENEFEIVKVAIYPIGAMYHVLRKVFQSDRISFDPTEFLNIYLPIAKRSKSYKPSIKIKHYDCLSKSDKS